MDIFSQELFCFIKLRKKLLGRAATMMCRIPHITKRPHGAQELQFLASKDFTESFPNLRPPPMKFDVVHKTKQIVWICVVQRRPTGIWILLTFFLNPSYQCFDNIRLLPSPIASFPILLIRYLHLSHPIIFAIADSQLLVDEIPHVYFKFFKLQQ